MPELQRTTMNPPGVSPPQGLYSHVARVKAPELVFIAGQVALDASGNLVGPGDVGAQTTQVFSNLGQILASVGATFRNVVEFNVYLVARSSIQPYIGARTEILKGAFPDGDYPPSTLVVVDGLAAEEYLVEIKAVAALA